MKRARVAVIAAAALVLLVGVAIVVWSSTRPETPDAVAERYLQALAAGDEPALTQLLGGAIAPESAEAFAGAAERISDPRLDRGEVPDPTADAVVLTATAGFGDEEGVIEIGLHRVEDRWRVDPASLPVLWITPEIGDAVQIGGAIADAPIPVLPAVYPVRAVPTDVLAGRMQVAAVAGTREVDLAVTGASAAQAVLQAALDEFVRECTADADHVVQGCGFGVPWGLELSQLTRVSYEVVRSPRLTPDARLETFHAEAGTLEVTVTGVDDRGESRTANYRVEDWRLRGAIVFDGVTVELQTF